MGKAQLVFWGADDKKLIKHRSFLLLSCDSHYNLLQRAKELLSGVADGVDPLTGEVLPEDHVCNKAEIIRAFHCVLKALPGKPPKPQPENAGKPWNDADDAVLCQMFDAGGSKKEMCDYFKRSEGSLAARLVRLGKISDRAEFRMK